MRNPLLFASLSVLPAASAAAQQAPDTFLPLATLEIDGGVAEIVAATADENTLVYTDSDAGALGIVDVTNPATPAIIAQVPLNGEPTSVSIVDQYAFANVWVDKPSEGAAPPAFLPGEMVVVDISNPASPVVVGTVAIGYHPDSIQVAKYGDQYVAVIAIENEPVVVENGVVTGDDEPGDPNDISPNGFVQVIDVDVVTPANSTVVDVQIPAADLTAAGCLYPNDVQPEFVDIHGTTVAVSLQENNGIAIIELAPAGPSLTRAFSLGTVSDRPADITEEDAIDFDSLYPATVIANGDESTDPSGNIVPAGTRCPDAISFSPSGDVIYSADEGEFNYTGGRGWSAWDLNGNFLWDDGGALEAHAVARGHYPEGRSENKGIEMEGITTVNFGGNRFAIVLSERGSFAAIYRLRDEAAPLFVQIVPTGIEPEGVVALPSKNVFLTSDEESGTLSFFQGFAGRADLDEDKPALISGGVDEPWAAISGMAALPNNDDALLFVPNNALPTSIFRIDLNDGVGRVTNLGDVTIGGVGQRYDGEGLAIDTSIMAPANPAVWIASEGNASDRPNLLVQIDNTGEVVREIQLPVNIDAAADPSLSGNAQGGANGEMIRSNGFEGVCLSDDGRYLFAVIQRDFAGEFTSPKYARIARYDLEQLVNNPSLQVGLRAGGDWEFFFYQLDSDDGSNWAGLSEIINLGGDSFAVIERDKGIGAGSQLKKIYEFDLSGLTGDSDGLPGADDTVSKTLLFDIRDAFSPLEKVEGLALTEDGDLWVGLDNDGGEVESRLINLGDLP